MCLQGKKLLQQGIDDLKLITRRYSKKQNKWVMNRLIRRGDRQVINVTRLAIKMMYHINSINSVKHI